MVSSVSALNLVGCSQDTGSRKKNWIRENSLFISKPRQSQALTGLYDVHGIFQTPEALESPTEATIIASKVSIKQMLSGSPALLPE
jgi:hypothetical protein